MNSSIKERDMKALARYQEELQRNPQLQFIFFELTDQCNLNCLHCGSNCEPGRNTFLASDDIRRTLLSILREYAPEQVMVCLTGGEPMLHSELPQIIRMAHDMGFPVGITTNGTLINEKAARELAESGLNTIAISLDGPVEVHDAFRRSPGSFERAMAGARAMKQAGIEPQAVTVASKMNLNRLLELADRLMMENFCSWRITNMDPIGRAQDNRELLLNREEMFRLLDYIRELRYDPAIDMEVTYGCAHFLGYEYERHVRDFYFQCGAGLQIGSVTADGKITACLDLERRQDLIQGNIREDDFLTVWKERFSVFRVNRAERSEFCRDCAYKTVCRGDSAHTWDYDQERPDYCLMKE